MRNPVVAVLFLVLLVNSAYLAALPTPTVFYMSNVLVHLGTGLVLAAALRLWYRPAGLFALGSALLATVSGLYLATAGNTRPHRWALVAHIVAALVAVSALVPWLWKRTSPDYRRALAAALAILVVLPSGAAIYRRVSPDPRDRIRNPEIVPVSMEEEGGGPKSPFWPSAARTSVGGIIPSDFFMDSKRCGECHKDIYEQWNSSVHHFASFNNQFYRKSIEQMQELGGQQGSKWCAGCHDHAVFFNGRFDKPVKDQIDTAEAQNGLGCVSCHSVTQVGGSMGNGDFTMEYPPLHDLASSRNPVIRNLDYFLTYAQPEPHRRTFLKPFMKEAEFCSACHKVHLDVPVNNYRWLRGFNDYDNWQASGVSGQGARSFYYPAQTSACADCHMPLVASRDPGNRDGKVHSHRFPAANTAVAYANRDAVQLKTVEEFLKSGFISVDIFAATPVTEGAAGGTLRKTGEGPQLSSTFAVGEEAEQQGQVLIREVGKLAAPIDRVGALPVEPGSAMRVDVVVRTRKIGHFFPGGTVDSFDVWLELQAKDATGRTVFRSGEAADGGRGPVDPAAHFYRSQLIDGEGNPINKRNAWQARSTVYVRLIPPGAADVVHYRVRIPKDAQSPVTLEARLNYRKFSHYYTQYAYAGTPAGGSADKTHDSRHYTFVKTNIPKNVSGSVKDEIPDIPIVTLASAAASVPLGGAGDWTPKVLPKDRERWNDWGIGLLLQGDIKGAEYAFRRVTEAEPNYADGWLNVARALIQEGETDAAKPFVEKAMRINPSLGRIYFFKALAQKAEGDYDGALESLRRVTAQYPRDRVVLNQIGRIAFLKRDYQAAVEALRGALAVDPEDVQAHYTLMLCYRGLGDTEKAAREEKLFRRFKADESSQALTGKRRLISPEDNNERQMIHDHE